MDRRPFQVFKEIIPGGSTPPIRPGIHAAPHPYYAPGLHPDARGSRCPEWPPRPAPATRLGTGHGSTLHGTWRGRSRMPGDDLQTTSTTLAAGRGARAPVGRRTTPAGLW